MKKYNIQNYIRYKEDVKQSVARLEGKMWDEYTRDCLLYTSPSPRDQA